VTNDDRTEFFQICVTLAAVTRAELDEPTQHLYWQAMRDVPMELVRRASVDLTKGSKFMPTPAEWRAEVDRVLDRRPAKPAQGLLPGDVGDFRCDACDNTGFVGVDEPCSKGIRCGTKGSHTHRIARRCGDEVCARFRAAKTQRKRRYSRRED
jgi:hypothetical protein